MPRVLTWKLSASSRPAHRKRFNRYLCGIFACGVAIDIVYRLGERSRAEFLESLRANLTLARLVEGARNDPDAVTRLPVRTERGLFPVGQLAGVREERGPHLVNRENGQRKDRRRR